MRIKTRFSFNPGRGNEHLAKEALTTAGQIPTSKNSSGMCVIELYEDDPHYNDLLEFFDNNNIDPVAFDDEVFTENERLEAPVMRMVPNSHKGRYPQPENKYIDVSYDENSGCPYCTYGKIQNRPLRLSGAVKMGKRDDISGIWWMREFIVTKRFKELAEEEGLTGCEFWPIIKHERNEPFEDIFQLKITGVMPKMAKETEIVQSQEYGNKCGHMRTYVDGHIYYNASDLENVSDFALTQKWFDMLGEIWRWPFMSQKAYRFFKENRISGVRFYPPEILDK
ncbi:MAG: hypothetical protein IJ306_09705 [Oscillospiraceae bacterium]|nr:hypothetical protein [Oscillospiraceae bacterium]